MIVYDDKMYLDAMQNRIKSALDLLGEVYPSLDTNDEHLKDTPKRIAKMWIEQFKGLKEMDFDFTCFENTMGYDWVIKKDIEFSSMCEHHFMPFFGKVTIAYIPNDKICGLSKLDRVTNYYSKRPQVQERLGRDILNFLIDSLQPKACIVIIESLHTCVACRGIESRNSTMKTICFMGNEDQRKEILGML